MGPHTAFLRRPPSMTITPPRSVFEKFKRLNCQWNKNNYLLNLDFTLIHNMNINHSLHYDLWLNIFFFKLQIYNITKLIICNWCFFSPLLRNFYFYVDQSTIGGDMKIRLE
jgi:hypothetical protein